MLEMSHLSAGDTILSRYEIIEMIGRGGFATVYLANQLTTGQLVAIKVLDLLTKEESRRGVSPELARFEREKRLISQLSSPNVVQLVDWGEHDGSLVMVLEYVDGRDLEGVLDESGALPVKLVKRIALQVLEVLEEAHEKGIVHRDLKPANIMLVGRVRRPGVKVLDFGIAGMVPERRGEDWVKLTGGNELRGTPAYMAPEQIFGESVPQSDIYALGLILLECLTGSPAVSGDTPMKVIFKQAQDTLDIPKEIAESPFGPVIAKACAKKIEERYASASAMVVDVEAIYVDEADTTSLEIAFTTGRFSIGRSSGPAATPSKFESDPGRMETIDQQLPDVLSLRDDGSRDDPVEGASRRSPTTRIVPVAASLLAISLVLLVVFLATSGGESKAETGDSPESTEATTTNTEADAGSVADERADASAFQAMGDEADVQGADTPKVAQVETDAAIAAGGPDVSAPEEVIEAGDPIETAAADEVELVWTIESKPSAAVYDEAGKVCSRTPCEMKRPASFGGTAVKLRVSGYHSKRVTLPKSGGTVSVTLHREKKPVVGGNSTEGTMETIVLD